MTIKKNCLTFIISFFKFFSLISSYTPYSECTVGRITGYTEYEEGGSCGFGVPKIYGAAPNEAFYNLGDKCGICYELIGPNGVLFFMVDSHCPVKGNEGACSGDMYHFDLHKNGYYTIIDEGIGTTNVTFRMVSCDHKSNMILKTKPDVTKYFFSFVILYHNIGLKKIYYSYDNKAWTGLEREGDYNHWTIRNVESLPIYIQLESISGEKVQTTINEIIKGHQYDTGVQFSVPNKYYDPLTLQEIKSPKTEDCCKLYDAFTEIYHEGIYIGEWQDISSCERDNEYSNDCYSGEKCVRVDFKDWKVYQFFNRVKPETRRYSAIKFMLKTENVCNECIKLKLDDYDFYYISTKEANKWEEINIKLEDLGLESTTEKFRKFMFQGRKVDSQIAYFDDIQLVKSDYNDPGICKINTIQDDEVYEDIQDDELYQDNQENQDNQDNENKAMSSTFINSIILILSTLITTISIIYKYFKS